MPCNIKYWMQPELKPFNNRSRNVDLNSTQKLERVSPNTNLPAQIWIQLGIANCRCVKWGVHCKGQSSPNQAHLFIGSKIVALDQADGTTKKP